MLQNATPLRKLARPPNSSGGHVSCAAPATENASLQILFKRPTPAIVFGHATKINKTLTFCSLLTRCTIPCACHARRHLNVQKSGAFDILTSKCASRHNGVHFFDVSTSKSGPELVCFVHFDFETCFAPQRRSLFRQLNLQMCSEREVILAFSLANVLRARTACTFSTSQLPKVSKTGPELCASRHNGVHFFDISISKSGPSMWCFVHFDFQMCFAPQRRAIFHLSSGQLAPHPPL